MLEGFTPWPPKEADEYKAKGYWPGIMVHGILEHWARESPSSEALVDEKGRWTFGELQQEVERLAVGLCRLGIKPLADQEFRLADGTKIRRKKGGALFKYGERIGVADVIFGERGDSTLLGAFTLESLGLSLDPLRRELKPLPMVLAVLPSASPGGLGR